MIFWRNKMKILFNTRFTPDNNMMVRVYNETLKYWKTKGQKVYFNDWKHYEKYDVILFYTGESEIKKVRQRNPKSVIGIIDPSPNRVYEASIADFLIICALEQRDFWLKYNRNILFNLAIPDIKIVKFKKNYNKKTIRIGYHGNLVHLNCFFPDLSDVLDKLADFYQIELVVIYNIKAFGKWSVGRPKKIKVIDVQWSNNVYEKEFFDIDIGIAPSFIPNNFYKSDIISKFLFNSNSSDYVNRYKISSNPGRLFPFFCYKIPVVADAIPSNAQIIENEKSGYLVNNKFGWFYCLETLITNVEIRKRLGNNCFKTLDHKLNLIRSKNNLLFQIKNLHNNNSIKNNITFQNTNNNYFFQFLTFVKDKFFRKISLFVEKIS